MNWLDEIYNEFSEYKITKNTKLNINNHEKIDLFDHDLDIDINPHFNIWEKEIAKWSKK